MTAVDLAPYLETCRRRVDRQLDRVLPPEGAFPDVLHRAMRYSTLAGGKRVRAALAIASAEACGRDDDAVLPAAAALELIHAYSLIHDDLPAMDDDDIRRGRPTNHKVFGEAMAILAGDALLTLAFHVLADDGLNPNLGALDRIRVIQEIGRAAGHGGLVGGQAVDVASEGLHADMAVLEYIHTHKTGALIRAAVRAGAIVGGAGESDFAALSGFGEKVGLAFQIVDDLLDVEGDPAVMGKGVGGDSQKRKQTYPRLLGLVESRGLAKELVEKALGDVERFDERAGPLRAMARFIVERKR